MVRDDDLSDEGKAILEADALRTQRLRRERAVSRRTLDALAAQAAAPTKRQSEPRPGLPHLPYSIQRTTKWGGLLGLVYLAAVLLIVTTVKFQQDLIAKMAALLKTPPPKKPAKSSQGKVTP